MLLFNSLLLKLKKGKLIRKKKFTRKLGKLKEIEISGELTNDDLCERIWNNKEQYIKKYIVKSGKVDANIKINGQEVQQI